MQSETWAGSGVWCSSNSNKTSLLGGFAGLVCEVLKLQHLQRRFYGWRSQHCKLLGQLV